MTKHDVEQLREIWVAIADQMPGDQAEIAKAAGVTVEEIDDWAKGAFMPPPCLDILAAALGEYGVEEVEEPPVQKERKACKAKPKADAGDAAAGAGDGGTGNHAAAGDHADDAGADDAAEFFRKWQARSEELHGHGAPTGRTYDELLAAATEMTKETPYSDVEQLITDAAALKIDIESGQGDDLITAIVRSRGPGKRALKNDWKKIALKVRAAEAPTEEEAAARAEEMAARQQAEEEAAAALERDRLTDACKDVMNDLNILKRHTDLITRMGVVSEDSGKKSAVLVQYGRLGASPFSLARLGALASGKNHLLNSAFKLCPPEGVIVISGGSDKGILFLGDEDYFKYKVLYLVEAAGTMAPKNGEESTGTVVMREVLSEGKFSYIMTQKADDGIGMTAVTIVKNGPTAIAVTSARANIEAELLSRMLVINSDESHEQTARVLNSIASGAAGNSPHMPPTPAEIEEIRDYQRLLALDAGYQVVVPFAEAIYALMGDTAEIRIRRDITSVINVIRASTIMHRFQRKLDAAGRLVATIDDYRNAVDAVGQAVTSCHRSQLDPKVLAVVRVIEDAAEAERVKMAAAAAAGTPPGFAGFAGAAPEVSPAVRLTYNDFFQSLGINSPEVLKKRLDAAVSHHVIERVPEAHGGRSAGMRYRVLIPSAQLQQQIDTERLLPTAEEVKALCADPAKLAAMIKDKLPAEEKKRG